MLVEGEKISLRYMQQEDFGKILKWRDNKLLTYYIGERLPKSLNECKNRYLMTSKLLNQIFGIENKKGEFIGEIEIDHIMWKDKQAELFMYIGEQDLWGKGYGSDALKTFLKYIFHVKKFRYIYLRVYQHNPRAIKCYEKCGFKKRGILKIDKHKVKSDNLVLMDINFRDIKEREAFFQFDNLYIRVGILVIR